MDKEFDVVQSLRSWLVELIDARMLADGVPEPTGASGLVWTGTGPSAA